MAIGELLKEIAVQGDVEAIERTDIELAQLIIGGRAYVKKDAQGNPMISESGNYTIIVNATGVDEEDVAAIISVVRVACSFSNCHVVSIQ